MRNKILGNITNVELKKNGSDDWQCDYILVIDVTGKRNSCFGFDGNKITTKPSTGRLLSIKVEDTNTAPAMLSSSVAPTPAPIPAPTPTSAQVKSPAPLPANQEEDKKHYVLEVKTIDSWRSDI